jgi:hypothetical protein
VSEARAYRVWANLGKKELGRVLGRSEEEALDRARGCWPAEDSSKFYLEPVQK